MRFNCSYPCFDFALNSFRLVMTHLNWKCNLGGYEITPEERSGLSTTIYIYTHNFRSLPVSLPTIPQVSDKFNCSVVLRTEESSCETIELKLKQHSTTARDLTMPTIFSSLSRDFCVKGNNGREKRQQQHPV